MVQFLIKNKRIVFFTQIGQSTLPIFIMHGFIVMFCSKIYTNNLNTIEFILFDLIITFAITYLLSRRPFTEVFDFITFKR